MLTTPPPPLGVEIKNVSSYTCAHILRLEGMLAKPFTFTLDTYVFQCKVKLSFRCLNAQFSFLYARAGLRLCRCGTAVSSEPIFIPLMTDARIQSNIDIVINRVNQNVQTKTCLCATFSTKILHSLPLH
jgi:hypothetical protein